MARCTVIDRSAPSCIVILDTGYEYSQMAACVNGATNKRSSVGEVFQRLAIENLFGRLNNLVHRKCSAIVLVHLTSDQFDELPLRDGR